IVIQNGVLLNERAKVLKQWREHFSLLLNCETRDAATESSNEEPEQEETVPSTTEEVNKAIQSVARNKSPRSDGISAELFKYGRQMLATLFHNC
ncbi:hypothetical protein ILUMI_14765, partial [Ignelater luminosus]